MYPLFFSKAWQRVYTIYARAARISIACSILRILPRGNTRILVQCVTWSFGLACLVILFFKSLVCGRNKTWEMTCELGKPLDYATLCSECSSYTSRDCIH